jgi:hypothetical protein
MQQNGVNGISIPKTGGVVTYNRIVVLITEISSVPFFKRFRRGWLPANPSILLGAPHNPDPRRDNSSKLQQIVLLEPWPLSQFLDLYTVGRTPWTGDQAVWRPLPTHRTTQTQNKHTDIHASSRIRTHDPSVREGEDSSCLRPCGHCVRPLGLFVGLNSLTNQTNEVRLKLRGPTDLPSVR